MVISTKKALFTIGHSNHELEKFLHLLQINKIEVLVDVRSNPYSRYASWFNKASIQKAIHEKGMRYLFLGKELGGKPKDREFYDSEGHVLYSRLSESPLFLGGIERLIKGSKNYRIALMCSEEKPMNCHRYLLICRVLEDRGITVSHIRGDNRIQSRDEISRENEKQKRSKAQQNLFDIKGQKG